VVLLKPNWVLHRHHSGLDMFSVITHPYIIGAAVDLIWESCPDVGEIIVADAPQADCDFGEIRKFAS